MLYFLLFVGRALVTTIFVCLFITSIIVTIIYLKKKTTPTLTGTQSESSMLLNLFISSALLQNPALPSPMPSHLQEASHCNNLHGIRLHRGGL